MSTQENKAVIRRYFDEALNQGNMALVDEIFSERFIAYAPRGATSDLTALSYNFQKALRNSFRKVLTK